MTILSAAQDYTAVRRWSCIDMPFRTKKPIRDEWQNHDEMMVNDDIYRQQFVGIVGDGAVVLFRVESTEAGK